MRAKRSPHQGIRTRHSRNCPRAVGDQRCRCKPSYEAWVYSKRDARKIRKTFPTLAAAKAWRADANVALRRGTMRAATRVTLRETAEAWLESAKAGAVRDRSGRVYKPSTIRSYEAALRQRILPDLGGARLTEITRTDLQDLADRLLADGRSASTIRNTLMPLQAIYRRAMQRGDVAVNPTSLLDLPAVSARRDRALTAEQVRRLLAAHAPEDRALWATAFYTGARLGELQALRWEDLDLAAGLVHVVCSYDEKARLFGETKNRKQRTTPIPGALRDKLVAHKMALGHDAGLVFGRSPAEPFAGSTQWRRAQKAWKAAALPGAPLSLHEARHTYISLMHDAGLALERIGDYVGHSSAYMTDRYRHLLEGHEAEAAAKFDAYLARADWRGRLAQVASDCARAPSE